MSMLASIRNQRDNWRRDKAPAKPAEIPDFRPRVLTGMGGTEAAEIADGYVEYAQVYRTYAWVRKAIDVTARNIVGLPVRVVDGDDKPQEAHPLTLLLSRGNDTMAMSTIWAHWVTSMYLGGEGPLEIIDDQRGNPLWLWPRRPDLVFVRPDMTPERQNYPTAAGYMVLPEQGQGTPMDVPPQNMVFSRFVNPLNGWRGLAPVAALRASVVIDLFAMAWAKTFLQRGARPDYALVAPQGITKSERERLEAELMFKFGGAANWHKPIVLEDGVTDIKTFSFAPVDMEWVEQRQFTRDEIGALFGVPDEIMGYGKDTYENFQTALEVFWTLTLKPLIAHRDDSLNHFFTAVRPLLEPGLRIATDLSSVGVLQEDKLPKVEMAAKLWAMGAPFNQLDAALQLGIGPVPNGDQPFGTDPVEKQRMVELAAMGQQAQAGDGAQGPAAQDEEDAPDEGEDVPVKLGTRNLSTRAAWAAYKALLLLHDPDDDSTAEERALREAERVAQREIAAALRDVYRNILPPNAEDMDLFELQAYLDDRATSQALADAIDATVRRATDIGVNIAADQLASMNVGFDYTLIHTRAREWARQYSAELITNVGNTTKQAVRESVERWYTNGEPLDALTRDLSGAFDARRARLIAMTETTHSAAQGTLRGYEESGVVKALIWMTANDERVCPYCGSLDGQTVGLDGKFSDKLPPDLQAKLRGRSFRVPPAHPGCRCRIGAEVFEVGDA